MIDLKYLNDEQIAAFHALKDSKGQTIYHVAIENAIYQGNNGAFINLCKQLHNMIWEDCVFMEKILSPRAFMILLEMEFETPLYYQNYTMIKRNIVIGQNQLQLETLSKMVKERIEDCGYTKLANELYGLIQVRSIELMLQQAPVTE